MCRIGRNAIFNILSKLWSMVSIFLFVPFYVKFLGVESYGIVSFFATMQMTINLVGFGLSNTLKREFAVSEDNEKESRKFKLLRSVEIIYWVISIVVAVICMLTSGIIANKWLTIETLNVDYVACVITLMGGSIAIQLIANLYLGCLLGLDYQSEANILSIIWSACKNCGAVLILWKITSDLRIFYTWHILLDILYTIILRYSIGRKLKREKTCKWGFRDFVVLKRIAKYAAGVFVISVIALINKQLDKILISNRLTLTELGAYNLAITLGNLTTIVSTAAFTSVLPSLTQLVSRGESIALNNIFSRCNRVVNIVTGCLGGFVAVFAMELLQIWLGTTSYNEILRSSAPFVVLAIAITEFQSLPYALALAYGNTNINMLIGIIFIPMVCIFTWIGIEYWRLMGASVAYFIMMLSQTLIYEFAVLKKYTKISVMENTIFGFVAIIISLFVALVTKYITVQLELNIWLTVCAAVISGIYTLLIMLLVFARKQIANIL